MMRMLRQIDVLVAKRFFFPIIVWICRRTGVSQYGFASYAAVLSLLCIVPLIVKRGADAMTIGQFILLGLVGAMLAVHAMRPEMVRRSRGLMRAFIWSMIALNTIDYLTGNFRIYALLLWTFQLFAEYALMIDHIPPAQTKTRKADAAKARSS
jgi:hypothetical protein